MLRGMYRVVAVSLLAFAVGCSASSADSLSLLPSAADASFLAADTAVGADMPTASATEAAVDNRSSIDRFVDSQEGDAAADTELADSPTEPDLSTPHVDGDSPEAPSVDAMIDSAPDSTTDSDGVPEEAKACLGEPCFSPRGECSPYLGKRGSAPFLCIDGKIVAWSSDPPLRGCSCFSGFHCECPPWPEGHSCLETSSIQQCQQGLSCYPFSGTNQSKCYPPWPSLVKKCERWQCPTKDICGVVADLMGWDCINHRFTPRCYSEEDCTYEGRDWGICVTPQISESHLGYENHCWAP